MGALVVTLRGAGSGASSADGCLSRSIALAGPCEGLVDSLGGRLGGCALGVEFGVVAYGGGERACVDGGHESSTYLAGHRDSVTCISRCSVNWVRKAAARAAQSFMTDNDSLPLKRFPGT